MTHAERAERRRRIVQSVKKGLDVKQAAERFNLSEATVLKACYEDPEGAQVLRDRRRRGRRDKMRQIARAVRKEKLSLTAAAEKFHVSSALVREACTVHGVKPFSVSMDMPVKTLEIVAELARGKPVREICTERGLSRERVRQIKEKAQVAGVLPAVKRLDRLLVDHERVRQTLNEHESTAHKRGAQLAGRLPLLTKDVQSHFAESLRRCRKAAGLTVAAASSIAGISPISWLRYELGMERNPHLDRLIAIAAALGIKLGDLLDVPDKDSQPPLPTDRAARKH